MDPYKVLGIKKTATAKGIKSAYRKLSSVHHPDKPSGNEDKFKELSEAYKVLKDPKRRERYDTTGRTSESKATPDRIRAFIQTTVRTLVEAVRQDGTSDDPVFENIKDKVIMSLLGARTQIKNDMFNSQRKLERTQRLIERFKLKETDTFDPVQDSLVSEKKRIQSELEAQEDALELSMAVEKVLKTYDYEVGPGPEGQSSPGPTRRRSGPLFVTFQG